MLLLLHISRRLPPRFALPSAALARQFSGTKASPSPQQFEVTLDNDTLYIPQALAERLGWTEGASVQGTQLSLHGWKPSYFAIAQTGTDAELLARGTIESSRNPKVIELLEYLKER